MGFLDLDELEQDSKNVMIVTHPLHAVISESVKAAYLNLLVFACLLDDEELVELELDYGRQRAISLDLTMAAYNDAVTTVRELKGPKERKEFLLEMLSLFNERSTAMFLLCDMAYVMALNGVLSKEACQFLNSIYRLLLQSSKCPDHPLRADDVRFLSDYRPFLAPGKTGDANEVVHAYRLSEYDFPADLISFFSPDIKPIILKGGICEERLLRIVSGVFELDSELTLTDHTKVVFKDAEIRFGPQGQITLKGNRYRFENCIFKTNPNAPVDKDRQAEEESDLVLCCKTTPLGTELDCTPTFIYYASSVAQLDVCSCQFHGNYVRKAITGNMDAHNRRGARVSIEKSSFHSLKATGFQSSIVEALTLDCQTSTFVDCSAVYLIYASEVTVKGCQLDSCEVEEAFFASCRRGFCLDVTFVKFTNCSSSDALVAHNTLLGGCLSKDDRYVFQKYCAVKTKYQRLLDNDDSKSSWYHSEDAHYDGESMTEAEYQVALEGELRKNESDEA